MRSSILHQETRVSLIQNERCQQTPERKRKITMNTKKTDHIDIGVT